MPRYQLPATLPASAASPATAHASLLDACIFSRVIPPPDVRSWVQPLFPLHLAATTNRTSPAGPRLPVPMRSHSSPSETSRACTIAAATSHCRRYHGLWLGAWLCGLKRQCGGWTWRKPTLPLRVWDAEVAAPAVSWLRDQWRTAARHTVCPW